MRQTLNLRNKSFVAVNPQEIFFIMSLFDAKQFRLYIDVAARQNNRK